MKSEPRTPRHQSQHRQRLFADAGTNLPGGPLSSGDGAHRAIESFTVYSRFPSILDGSNRELCVFAYHCLICTSDRYRMKSLCPGQGTQMFVPNLVVLDLRVVGF